MEDIKEPGAPTPNAPEVSTPEDKFKPQKTGFPLHRAAFDDHYEERKGIIKRVMLGLMKQYNTTVRAPLDAFSINYLSDFLGKAFLLHDAVDRNKEIWEVEAQWSTQLKTSEVKPHVPLTKEQREVLETALRDAEVIIAKMAAVQQGNTIKAESEVAPGVYAPAKNIEDRVHDEEQKIASTQNAVESPKKDE